MSSNQQTIPRQRGEVEEVREFKRLHKANCCLFFVHLFLFAGLCLLVIGWQLQPDSMYDQYIKQETYKTTFDPETQTFVSPVKNGTNQYVATNWADMSGFSVLRDFINNAFGRQSQKPFGQKDKWESRVGGEQEKQFDEDDDSLS